MACVAASVAQGDVPPIALERRETTNQKKDLGPRALGLLQMNANGKPTLVPITILINGKFYDATAYKAAPVPMALESGTVYEGERSGKSIGLFTVNSALRSQAPNTPVPWLGAGTWLPAGTEAAKNTRKAENVPVGIEGVDEGPPRLKKGGAEDAPPTTGAPSSPQGGSTSTPAPAQNTPSSTPSGSAQTPNSSSTSAPPSSALPNTAPQVSSAPSSGTSTSGTPSSSPQAGSQPASGSTAQPQSSGTSTPAQAKVSAPESDSGAGESGRPLLRRGKPNEPLPEDDIPGYGKVNASGVVAKSDKDKGAKTSTSSALTPTELVPAISDAGGPTPHSFVYDWEHGEERGQNKQMLGLASDALQAYLKAKAKSEIVPKPSSLQAGARRSSPKAKEPVFENVKLRTFDLWGNNQPVMVLSAEAHFPTSAGTATTESTTYSVTIAARTDIYNNIHKLYAGITDKYHLDVTPRLELIDAVDADGDGRGELLFREISDIGSGYVIYRATSDTLWKMFDSLNVQ